MARQRAVVQAFTGDGPILIAIHDVLADLHDLLDARLPKSDGGGPVRIGEPAPAGRPPKAVPVSEPAPDDPPEDDDAAPAKPAPAPGLPEPPPRAGRGSSLTAWQAWAALAGVPIGDGMSRDDIIDVCVIAGVLSEK